MNTKRAHTRRTGRLRCRGLWIPKEIERISEKILCSRQKRLCGRINSFGVRGCYESESTLGAYIGVSRYTIMRDIKRLKQLRLILWLKVNGSSTCMWLRVNAKVQAAEYIGEDQRRMKNPAFTCGAGATGGVAQAQQVPVAQAQHNYNKRITTITAASPTPAEQQARRLKEKEAQRLAELDTEIRAEVWKRLPLVKPGDWDEQRRRFDVLVEVSPKVKEGIKAGLSVAEAVDRVYTDNEELFIGGKQR